jgi:hypothetical protein
VAVLGCVDENLLEVEFSDSDNETDSNQESEHRLAHQTVNKVTGKQFQWLACCGISNENLATGCPLVA